MEKKNKKIKKNTKSVLTALGYIKSVKTDPKKCSDTT